jgi:hypothetical protein
VGNVLTLIGGNGTPAYKITYLRGDPGAGRVAE